MAVGGQKINIIMMHLFQWDKLNTEGKHLYGVAETDAHYPVDIGKVYLKTYSESFMKKV